MQTAASLRDGWLFRLTTHIKSPFCTSGWIFFSCSQAGKTPWRGRNAKWDLYPQKQHDNLCCAAERGCCCIVIKRRCAGQMWNVDNELYRAVRLGLWLASQAEQGELQAAQNASESSSYYLALIMDVFDLCTLWSHPCSARSPIKSTHVLWEVQAA